MKKGTNKDTPNPLISQNICYTTELPAEIILQHFKGDEDIWHYSSAI